jgi:hypothetical protein
VCSMTSHNTEAVLSVWSVGIVKYKRLKLGGGQAYDRSGSGD